MARKEPDDHADGNALDYLGLAMIIIFVEVIIDPIYEENDE